MLHYLTWPDARDLLGRYQNVRLVIEVRFCQIVLYIDILASLFLQACKHLNKLLDSQTEELELEHLAL